MGFSVSATMAIFFAAFLILFSILYSSVNDAFDKVTESFDDKYEDLRDKSETSLEAVSAVYLKDLNVLQVKIRNTGSTSLMLERTTVIVNGTLEESVTMSIEGTSSAVWFPTDTLVLNISDPDMAFDSQLRPRIVTNNAARLASPSNMSVGEEVYIIDGSNIDVFTTEGLFDFTITDPSHLVAPSDIKAFGDYLYVLDEGTHIDRFDLGGSWVDELINDSANTPSPRAIAVDSNYIYIVDNNSHIDRYSADTGVFIDELIPNGGTMTAPRDISVGAYIFIVDYSGGAYHIDRYNLDGTGGTQIVGASLLSGASDISTSAAGLDTRYLLVVNNTSEVLVFSEAGSLLATIEEGLSDSVRAVDIAGGVFVSDEANGLVIERLGTNVKVVTENGISETITI